MSQDSFPILPWDWPRGVPDEIKGIAECGFTFAGFCPPAALDECQKIGLKGIVRDPRLSYEWTGTIDIQSMEANLDSLVSEIGSHPALYGYFLTDEPRPKTYAQAFRNLALVANALRERTLGKVPYVNLLPGRAFDLKTDEYEHYIRTYVENLKPSFLSYDNYSLYQDGSIHYSYFDSLATMRRFSLEYGIPFWHILLSNAHFTYAEPSETTLRFQVYTSLAYGAKGISYFTYYSRDRGNYRSAPVDLFGNRTAVWYWLRHVNLQLKTLGPLLLKLTSTGVYHSPPPIPWGCYLLPGNTLIRKVRTTMGYGEFLIGEFKHEDGTPYAMLVNTSLTSSCRYEVEVDGGYELQRVSPFTAEVRPMDTEDWWLAPGQGILWRLAR